ncbi:MAG: hypothetical protein AABY47_03175 [Pseudomonadota bacterium]
MRLLIFIAMVLMTFTPATAESHDAILLAQSVPSISLTDRSGNIYDTNGNVLLRDQRGGYVNLNGGQYIPPANRHHTNLHDNRGYNDQNYNNPGLGHDKDLHKGKGKHKNQRTNGQQKGHRN